MPRRSKPIRSWLFNGLLCLVSLGVAAGVAEITLRFAKINVPSTVMFHPGKGFTRIPGAYYRHTKEGFSEGHFNRHGFRDVDREWEKPIGTFRIVVLGDSFTDALQVDLDASFPRLLESALARSNIQRSVEVLNLGQSGFGTTDEYLRYLHFGKKYSPDLVVVAFFVGNDVRNNSKVLNTESLNYYYVFEGGQLVLDTSLPDRYSSGLSLVRRGFQQLKQRSYLASLVSERMCLLRRRSQEEAVREAHPLEEVRPEAEGGDPFADYQVYAREPLPLWDDAWNITGAVFGLFRDATARDGARLAIVIVPGPEQIDPELQKELLGDVGLDLDFDAPDRRIEAIGQSLGVPVLSLTGRFREAYARTAKPLYGFDGHGNHGHWNEFGHETAAAAIEEFLWKQALLPAGEGDAAR